MTYFKPIPKLTSEQIHYFWSRVDILNDTKCWSWKYSTNLQGYGQIKFGKDKFGSHRIAFYLGNNFDPGNLLVCHTCDNPRCCNPNHLFLGTPSENSLDASAKGRLTFNRGSKHGMSKLTEKDVTDIRRMYSIGFNQVSIARHFSVHQCAISRIVSRKRWKHI